MNASIQAPTHDQPRQRAGVVLAAVAVSLIPLGYLALIWDTLPETLPMHFGPDGQPDRFGNRQELLVSTAVLAAVGVGTVLLMHWLPRIDPRRNLNHSKNALQRIGLGTTAFLALVSVGVIQASRTGSPDAVLHLLPFALLLFFALVGNYLTSLRPNYFAGIRTPWTLESDSVWRKTHRLGGKLMFWGSLALLPVLLVLPADGITPSLVAVGGLVLCIGYTVYYSYRIFQEEKANRSQAA